MKSFPAAESAWAAWLAARLRVLQTSCAEDTEEMRLELLREEIARHLRDVAPAQRPSHLSALDEQFPEFGPAPGSSAPAVSAESMGDLAVGFQTMPPEVLVADLLDAAPTLTAEQRAEYGRRLAAAGFGVAAPASAAAAFELPGEVRARFALSPNQTVDPARAMRLFGLLADLTLALDQLAWSVWKQIAPQSIIRRESGAAGDFRKLAALYLSGDPEVATPQLSQLLDKTRKLVAGLLAGMGPAGSAFTKNYLARFSPRPSRAARAAGADSSAARSSVTGARTSSSSARSTSNRWNTRCSRRLCNTPKGLSSDPTAPRARPRCRKPIKR